MTTAILKKRIQTYLEVGDDKIIKAVYTLLEAQLKATETNFEFSEEQIKELNKRRKAHTSGKSKTYTLSEIKNKILAKHKK
jgi:hypothetical protein